MAKKLLTAVAAVLVLDRKILFSKRKQNKHHGGFWELPGGKIEIYETPESALKRELKEELGIIVKEKKLSSFTFISYSYKKFHLLMPIYICLDWNGSVQPKEGQDIQWVDWSEMDALSVLPADKELLPELKKLIRKV
tara:strand:- start:213 stop:623 length:411 start_codon:yes stop_codon:yes gene_type:complete